MKSYPNIRKANRMIRRNGGSTWSLTLEDMLHWAPKLATIEHVLGRMSKSDLETFSTGDAADIKDIIKHLPREWGTTKKVEAQYRADLRDANKFLDTLYA